MDAPFGARSATCRTARFSVTLIFSPRNIASILARSPDCSATSMSNLSVVVDAIFRVIQVDADGLHRHPLAARRIIREQVSQVQAPHCRMVVFEGLPYRVFARRS